MTMGFLSLFERVMLSMLSSPDDMTADNATTPTSLRQWW
jgi:hypothetical protein